MGHSRKIHSGLAQEHSGSDVSLYLVKQIPSNGPRARFHGAPFEIVNQQNWPYVCVRNKRIIQQARVVFR